jgi:hypothetical protein
MKQIAMPQQVSRPGDGVILTENDSNDSKIKM